MSTAETSPAAKTAATEFWHSCFDAVPLPLCVLAQSGKICATNASWRKASQQDGQYVFGLVEGCIWQEQIKKLYQDETPHKHEGVLQQEIDKLQAGLQTQVTLELPAPSSNKLAWFRLEMTLLPDLPALPTFTMSSQSAPAHEMTLTRAILISVEDITRQKLEQEAMQTAAMAYQFSDLAILITDANARILAVNPGYTHLTGFSLEDVLGKNPGSFSSGRQSKDFYQLMWHAIKTNGSWQGEIWNRKKNGCEFAEWITINAIYSEASAELPITEREIVRYVAMFSDITEQKLASEKHWRLANFDPLTSLPNRRLMLDRLETELRKAHRHKRMVAVFFIDLDHFKEINDQLGHAMGDVLLLETARRLQACVRESDTVARLGGDEFIIVMGDFVDEHNLQQGNHADNSHSQVELLANKVLQTLAAPFQLGTQSANVSGSIGIALHPQDAMDSQSLLECADQAMYKAKHAGKNRFCYFRQQDTAETPYQAA